MRCVYVLMYRSNEEFIVDAAKRETAFGKPRPYAVFEDAITAERMKRDGDEIIKVPYFREDFPNVLRITEDDLNGTPLDMKPWTSPVAFSDDITPTSYPKVTCNKTVDEHTWTNRVD